MLQNFIINVFKSRLLTRHDPNGSVFYYSPEDLGLGYEGFEFRGDRGQRLRGAFYTLGGVKGERLIVFDHGMGCGHKAYMREIRTICERGYEVFAYDHTGTLDSEGEHIGGFTQSLVDLDYAISAIKAAGKVGERKIAVIGHSWGGFSTMNIAPHHPDITHVVSLSGFISPREMIECVLGKMKKHAPALFALEEQRFGAYAYADARYSLKTAKGTRALIIHSKDDPTCPISHLEKLRAALGEGGGVSYLVVDGKRHNPNFTEDAVRYKDGFFAELTRLVKRKKLSTDAERADFVASWDWGRMTEQDTELWDRIFEFIEE